MPVAFILIILPTNFFDSMIGSLEKNKRPINCNEATVNPWWNLLHQQNVGPSFPHWPAVPLCTDLHRVGAQELDTPPDTQTHIHTHVWARLSINKADSDWQAGPITATTGWRRPSNGHLRAPLSNGGKWSMSYWELMRKCSCACLGPLGSGRSPLMMRPEKLTSCVVLEGRILQVLPRRVITREHVWIKAPK